MTTVWPSPREFWEAVQSPQLCFTLPNLRDTLPALDRLGMPLVASGQFASVFKLNPRDGSGAMAVRCFRSFQGEREGRYSAIHNHLQKHPNNPLAHFQYAPAGMTVGGKRYPILIMDWVEGATLDVYIGQVLKNPKPERHLRHLADQWLGLMANLHAAGMAHGDLQHGNILVNNGTCTLVDFDGLFVPALAGLPSTETGHINYQHPGRSATYFDATLDRFSGLVIYLSLLALASRPGLWQEYHDENLLFKRGDFEQPGQSTLLHKVREIDSECRNLADALAHACQTPPNDCPYLADLAGPRSRRPAWLSAPLGQVAIPTREAGKGPVPSRRLEPRPGVAVPVQPQARVPAPSVRAPAWTQPAPAPPLVLPFSAQIRLASAWFAVLAVLASFLPALHPWAGGAAVVLIAAGWPLLKQWRIAGRFGMVWGLLVVLAVGVSSVSVPELLSSSAARSQAQSSPVNGSSPVPVVPSVPAPEAAPSPAQLQAAEHIARAEALLGQSDFTKAQAECDLALSLDPQNDRGRWLRDQIAKTRKMLGGGPQ